MLKDERYKQLMEGVGLPNSRSLLQALKQCAMEAVLSERAVLKKLGEQLRYTNDGELAECPCCGSIDVGGAHDNVHCYGCGLNITKGRPLKNAIESWNMRARPLPAQAVPEGWQLVPIEPTPAMLKEIHLIDEFSERALIVRYKTMLSAAPKP